MKKAIIIILLFIAVVTAIVCSFPKYKYTVERHFLDGGCDTIVTVAFTAPEPHFSRHHGYKDAVCRMRVLREEQVKGWGLKQ